MQLTGGAALITGGKRIGAAVARALAAAGMDVALSYNKSRAEAEAAAADITAAGRRAHIAAANLSNPDECRALVDEAAATFGRLDVVVNMASVYTATPFDNLDEHAWNATVDIDLRAAFLCARASLPISPERRLRRATDLPSTASNACAVCLIASPVHPDVPLLHQLTQSRVAGAADG